MTETDPDEATATTKSAPGTGSVADARLLAAQLFHETWRLLELEDRSRDDETIPGPAPLLVTRPVSRA
jgi:hypothetical protein